MGEEPKVYLKALVLLVLSFEKHELTIRDVDKASWSKDYRILVKIPLEESSYGLRQAAKRASTYASCEPRISRRTTIL